MNGAIRLVLQSLRHTPLDVPLIALLCVLAVLPMAGLYGSYGFLTVVVGGVFVLGVAHTAVGALRLRVWIRHLIGIPLALLYSVFALYPGELTLGLPLAGAWAALWRGLTNGWSVMLTAGEPMAATGVRLCLTLVLALAAAWAAFRLRGTAVAVAPLVPPLVLFTGALALTGHRHHELAIGWLALVVLTCLALLLLRSSQDAGQSAGIGSLRRFAFNAGVIAGCGVVGVLVATLLPITSPRHRASLRNAYNAPVFIKSGISPLAAVSSAIASPNSDTAFTVRFDRLPEGGAATRLPVAVLDSFDGAVWTTSARFVRAGTELPADPLKSGRAVAVRQRFDVPAQQSPFLPALARPTKALVGSPELVVDPLSGMLARTPNASGSMRYEVSSDVPIENRDRLRGAGTADRGQTAELLTVPDGLPPELESLARSTGGEGQTTFDRLSALETELRSDRHVFAPTATPGHSYGRLRLLFDTGADGKVSAVDRAGTAEQYASAFAVAARVQGEAARVVVGYRLDAVQMKAGVPITVTAGQLTAWPEVLLDVGWVAFDPVNPVAQLPDALADKQVTTNTTLPNVVAAAPASVDCLQTGSCALGKHDAGALAAARRVAPLLLLAIVVMSPLVLFCARQLLRRRRRSATSAAGQVLGAWFEARDRLKLAGLHVGRTLTISEVASNNGSAGLDQFPGAALLLSDLGRLVDEALYASSEPPLDRADSAWRTERDIEAEVAQHVGRFATMKASVDPRPLLWAISVRWQRSATR